MMEPEASPSFTGHCDCQRITTGDVEEEFHVALAASARVTSGLLNCCPQNVSLDVIRTSSTVRMTYMWVLTVKKRLVAVVFVVITLLLIYKPSHLMSNQVTNVLQSRNAPASTKSTKYAIYSCTTPSGKDQRELDYVFYLPLTALAWQRLGFQSLILIIGNRSEWTNSSPLNFVLDVLKNERRAELIFIDSPPQNRIFISQNARLFVSYMDQFNGQPDDILMTSDADLWPLRRKHFVPEEPYDLLLLNNRRAGKFQHENQTYDMQALSCIAASVRTWRQLIPHFPMHGDYTESILGFLERRFGPTVRQEVVLDSSEWYIDQKLISLNIYNWTQSHPDKKVVRMIEEGFFRVDRINWDGDWINQEEFEESSDSHLLFYGYKPEHWRKIQPLLNLMYGNDSWQTRWCDSYRNRFYRIIN